MVQITIQIELYAVLDSVLIYSLQLFYKNFPFELYWTILFARKTQFLSSSNHTEFVCSCSSAFLLDVSFVWRLNIVDILSFDARDENMKLFLYQNDHIRKAYKRIGSDHHRTQGEKEWMYVGEPGTIRRKKKTEKNKEKKTKTWNISKGVKK